MDDNSEILRFDLEREATVNASGNTVLLAVKANDHRAFSLGQFRRNIIFDIEESFGQATIQRLRRDSFTVNKDIERPSAIAAPVGADQRHRAVRLDLQRVAEPLSAGGVAPLSSENGVPASRVFASKVVCPLALGVADGDPVDRPGSAVLLALRLFQVLPVLGAVFAKDAPVNGVSLSE